MNSAQKHFLLTLGSVFIGLIISAICAHAIYFSDEDGLLNVFGLWFGGLITAAAVMDYMTSLSEYREVEEYSV